MEINPKLVKGLSGAELHVSAMKTKISTGEGESGSMDLPFFSFQNLL